MEKNLADLTHDKWIFWSVYVLTKTPFFRIDNKFLIFGEKTSAKEYVVFFLFFWVFFHEFLFRENLNFPFHSLNVLPVFGLCQDELFRAEFLRTKRCNQLIVWIFIPCNFNKGKSRNVFNLNYWQNLGIKIFSRGYIRSNSYIVPDLINKILEFELSDESKLGMKLLSVVWSDLCR